VPAWLCGVVVLPSSIQKQEYERQHFVPAVIQNRFRHPVSGLLFGHDSHNTSRNINVPVSPGNWMQYAFTYATWAGGITGEFFDVDNTVEHRLQLDYEQSINTALNAVETGTCDASTREQIVKFFAVSVARHPIKLKEYHDLGKTLGVILAVPFYFSLRNSDTILILGGLVSCSRSLTNTRLFFESLTGQSTECQQHRFFSATYP
jgi:hypothetical protein